MRIYTADLLALDAYRPLTATPPSFVVPRPSPVRVVELARALQRFPDRFFATTSCLVFAFVFASVLTTLRRDYRRRGAISLRRASTQRWWTPISLSSRYTIVGCAGRSVVGLLPGSPRQPVWRDPKIGPSRSLATDCGFVVPPRCQ